MHNEFTAIIERNDDRFVAHCPEILEAQGKGRTIEEARASLAEAIALIQEERDFDREVALVLQNQELMEFLDQRSESGPTYTIEEARRILEID